MTTPMRHCAQAIIRRNEAVTAAHHLIAFECAAIATEARAGQFAHLRASGTTDPLLRRPISIMLSDPRHGIFEVCIENVGRGTELLTRAAVGSVVDALGPLGNPWPLPSEGQRPVLVAGGIGVAPLIFLAETLQALPGDCYVSGLQGARSEGLMPCWLEFSARCEEYTAVTEDGSAGEEGLVTGPLARRLERGDVGIVYACGPPGMLRAVAAMCQQAQVPCQVSLEQWMGCGVGACLGCVIPTTAQGDRKYQRICADGPVFDATVVAWDEWEA